MVVGHDLVGVHLLGRELAVGRGDLEEIAAGAVARGDVDATVMEDRRGNDGGRSLARGARHSSRPSAAAMPATLASVNWMYCRTPPISATMGEE